MSGDSVFCQQSPQAQRWQKLKLQTYSDTKKPDEN
jgi:hypothetical protein